MKIKRFFCGILVLMLLVGMTACSKNEEEPGLGQGSGTGFRNGEDTSTEIDQPTTNVPAEAPSQQEESNGGTQATPEEGNASTPSNSASQGGSSTPAGGNTGGETTLTKKPSGNPLMREGKAVNTGILPSYDVDNAGFVKKVKLGDLKGQSLVLLAAHEEGAFFYRDSTGAVKDEWAWYEDLAATYGVNVKYLRSNYDKQYQQIVTYVNANKSLDLFSTHRRTYPQCFSLSGSLDPYIDVKKVGQAYGVDDRTLQQTKWDNTYRCIAPIGGMDVLWYNETMVRALGLQDPKTLWRQGQWDWNGWKTFVEAIPQNSPTGTKLCPWYLEESDAWYYWAGTNGVDVFELQTSVNKTGLVNHFEAPNATTAWDFYAKTVKGVNAYTRRSASGDPQLDMYTDGSAIMSATTRLMGDYSQYAYAKTQKYNWVPYPKGTSADATNLFVNYGLGMMLPKKMKTPANAPYAVKLMELWANRCTEAMNDYLQEPCFAFSAEERREYFEFAMDHSTFFGGLGTMRSLSGGDFDRYKNFIKAFYDANLDPVECAEDVEQAVYKAIEDAV